MTPRPLSGFTIGVTADRRASEQLDLLAARGADCIHGPAATDTTAAERLVRAVVDRGVDAVTFVERVEIEEYLAIAAVAGLRDEVLDALRSEVTPTCVDTACAAAIGQVGIRALVPDRSGLDAMVELLVRHLAARARTIELAGFQVHVQGRLVVLADGTEVWLARRERAILDALIERPGVVLSKRDLLRSVWRDLENDEHVVEVTVARLRRRLGPAAAGIETVVRRGYRIA